MKQPQAILLATTFVGLVACGAPDVPDIVPPGIPPSSDVDKSSSNRRDGTSSTPNAADDRPGAGRGEEDEEPAAPRGGGPNGERAPVFPRPADFGECSLGNGLYCAGNGVEGKPGTLYRCTDGTIDEEMTCASSCLFFRDGKNDACDGMVSECPLGNGLYCGDNGLSGDEGTLFRCNKGNVTIEQVCANTCVHEADGKNDRCE